ncbi:type II toxin-antitoxin system ParD family antitoxin [Salegentibacter sediminis]|uniref:type II toxin-antitoxin system ParD family antitoxin n=1 Tax=Salegentibacter sediminis TaxID=1930251 RepID=UPI0009BDF721|nr:type II toxin-antitoxin system ParD family antitoxin [Salegentibacter sediminis]
MKKKTEIRLDPYFEEFIKNEINSGKYDSVSEVVREGLKLLEEKEKLRALSNAIQEGIDSGIVEDFDSEEFLKRMKTENH